MKASTLVSLARGLRRNLPEAMFAGSARQPDDECAGRKRAPTRDGGRQPAGGPGGGPRSAPRRRRVGHLDRAAVALHDQWAMARPRQCRRRRRPAPARTGRRRGPGPRAGCPALVVHGQGRATLSRGRRPIRTREPAGLWRIALSMRIVDSCGAVSVARERRRLRVEVELDRASRRPRATRRPPRGRPIRGRGPPGPAPRRRNPCARAGAVADEASVVHLGPTSASASASSPSAISGGARSARPWRG